LGDIGNRDLEDRAEGRAGFDIQVDLVPAQGYPLRIGHPRVGVGDGEAELPDVKRCGQRWIFRLDEDVRAEGACDGCFA